MKILHCVNKQNFADKLNVARQVVLASAVALAGMTGIASAADLTKTVDVSGIESITYLSHPGNTVLEIYLGPRAHVTSFSWDTTLTAYAGSFMSEAYVQISDSRENNQLYFLPSEIANPGNGFYAGTTHFQGSVDFRTLDTPDGVFDYSFHLRNDGILRLEFAENMDDLPGADALWESGTFTIGYSIAAVPEPSSYAMLLLGLGALGAIARRNRLRR